MNLSIAIASLILFLSSSASAADTEAVGGLRRLSHRSRRAGECARILREFNSQAGFGNGDNSYIRSICAGNTDLLTIPKKAYVIYEKDCGKGGPEILDNLLSQAKDNGGCDDPVAGRPSEALQQYKDCGNDAKVAQNMVCTGAPQDKTCWKVPYLLQNEACWSADFRQPELGDNCLVVNTIVNPSPDWPFSTPTKDNPDNTPYVTCSCLRAYVTAYHKLSSTGKDSIGASKDTLQLVEERIELDC